MVGERVVASRSGGCSLGQAAGSATPVVGPRTSGGHCDLDAADADAYQRTDLEELETDGAAGGVGEGSVGQADPPQSTKEHIGHRGEPQPQLIGPHGPSRRAVGVKVELALLDPV